MTSSSRVVPFILITVLIDAIGFGIIIPGLPGLLMRVGHLDLSGATRIGGWLALTYAAVQFAAGPTVGNLSDCLGRRKVLLGALGGYAIDYALLCFANTLPLFFLGRALAGLFGATYGPASAAMADVTEPDERARLFGYIGGAFGIGFVVGPAIGGILASFGPRLPFAAAATIAAANFIYGLLLFPETLPPEKRRAFNWRRANPLGAVRVVQSIPGLPIIVLAYFLWQLASMVYPSVWAFYGIANFGWSARMIGISLALVGTMMALCQWFITGRAVKLFGERRTAQIGLGGAFCAFVAYALIGSGTVALIVVVVIAIQSLVQPSLSAMLSKRVPDDAQGEVQGISGSVLALGALFAPLIYNPALAWFTASGHPHWPGAPFAIAACFVLLTLATLSRTPRRAAAAT